MGWLAIGNGIEISKANNFFQISKSNQAQAYGDRRGKALQLQKEKDGRPRTM